MHQKIHLGKCKDRMAQRIKEVAHRPIKLGPKTHMAALQNPQEVHLAKVVPRRPGPGAAATPSWPKWPHFTWATSNRCSKGGSQGII
jgi:hypothetical protein